MSKQLSTKQKNIRPQAEGKFLQQKYLVSLLYQSAYKSIIKGQTCNIKYAKKINRKFKNGGSPWPMNIRKKVQSLLS